jgi:hypothetical protein
VGSRLKKGRQKSERFPKGRQIFSIPQIKFYHYSTGCQAFGYNAESIPAQTSFVHSLAYRPAEALTADSADVTFFGIRYSFSEILFHSWAHF